MSGRRLPRWAIVGAAVLAFAALTRLLFTQRAQRQALREVAFVSRSDRSWGEASPSVAVLEGGATAVTWLGHGPASLRAGHVGVRLLPAGSRAWGEPIEVRAPAGGVVDAAVVVPDAHGGGWLVLRSGEGAAARVFVAHAPREPFAFDAPRALESGQVVGTPAAATLGGELYVAFRETDDRGARLVVLRASDGRREVLSGAPGATEPALCAGGDSLYAAWISGGKLAVRLSKGGPAFAEERGVTVALPMAGLRCVAHGDELTLLHGLASPGAYVGRVPPLAAAVLLGSTDGGRTFPARSEVREPGLVLYAPDLTRDAQGGVVLVYYAARETEGAWGAARSTRLARVGEPSPGARELRAPVSVGRRPEDPRGVGERLGVAAGSGHLVAVTVDNVGEAPHVAFAELGE